MLKAETNKMVPTKLTLTPFLNLKTAENNKIMTPTFKPLSIAAITGHFIKAW